VHGNTVLEAQQADREPWPEADGLVSDRGSQSLWVCGADCTPVLLADPESGHVAACHAGWRGVASGILPEAVERLEQKGGHRSQFVVALGPAVSGGRYQVQRPVADQVMAAVPSTPQQRDSIVQSDSDPDRCRLDIRAAAALQLRALGVMPERISQCPLCTVSEPELFHSWRRDHMKPVQWSGIVSQAAL
jgi:YfiH family protein